MAFGRPALGRRALLAATLGAVYGLLLLPAPSTVIGVSVFGVAWFLLSIGLLFLTTLAYHAFTLYCLLWIVWKGINYYRMPGPAIGIVLDIGLPLAAVALLMSSGYLARARAYEASQREPA